MSSSPTPAPRSALSRIVNELEETVIAVLLGLMTMLTFLNVVLRYGFNASLIWGLELVLILFAWLVLFGMSYLVKTTAHLGVDALINILPGRAARIMALLAGLCCLVYGLLLLKGAWDFWAPFAGLEVTTGRWFPTGFDGSTRDRAFYETDQVPMIGLFRWLEGAINQGEAYEKLPRVIPYLIMPLGAALLVFRTAQAMAAIWTGKVSRLIVSYENDETGRREG
ncbi:MAG: TRAP transporter small permease [Pikeienuella sp.]